METNSDQPFSETRTKQQTSTSTQTAITVVENVDAQTEETLRKFASFKEFIRKKGIYIAMTTTFIGLFLGIPMLIYFWSTTLISTGTILLILFIAGALGLLQWKFVKDLLDMEYHQFSMYAFTGFGMCFTNFLFFLNHFILINTNTKTFDVVAFRNGAQGIEITLSGEGNNDNLERSVATFITENYDRIPVAKKIAVTTNTGLFGFEMIKDCKIN